MNICKKCNNPCPGRRTKFCSELCSKQFFSEKQKELNQTEQGKTKLRNKALTAKYGITVDQFNEILLQQGNVCKICQKPPKDGKWLCVDHNHNNLVVRDLLCSTCNLLIGLAKEDPTILSSSIDYVNKWRHEDNPELIKAIRFRTDTPEKEAVTKSIQYVAEEMKSMMNLLKIESHRDSRCGEMYEAFSAVQLETEGMGTYDIDKFLLGSNIRINRKARMGILDNKRKKGKTRWRNR